jgi:Spy/CpxP family protein refolding chaperone
MRRCFFWLGFYGQTVKVSGPSGFFGSSFVKIFMRATAIAAMTGVLLASVGIAAAQAPPMVRGQAQTADLPSLLHLRPDQMTAYNAVEAAGRDSPAVVAQLKAKYQRLAAETTPQRLDFQAEMLNLNVARAHRVMEAERKFYAVLTPEQQHTFDQITAPHPQQGPAQR